MKYEIVLLEEAESDIRESYEYFKLIDENLAGRFIDEITISLDFLKDHHSLFAKIYKNVRRFIVKKFPYLIYYYVDDEKLLVKIIGIFHGARDNKLIKKRNTSLN
jgi:toxin ParE1/3/4